jgi:hypothetical protein
MTRTEQGIVRDNRGEEQPADKDRAQKVHHTDQEKSGSARSVQHKLVEQERETPANPSSRDGHS